jgi:hypothetical protein
MSTQANVYTSVSALVWNTDKVRIATGNTAVTVTVNVAPSFSNAIFQGAQVPASTIYDMYVGVGNKLTIAGTNFTAQEVGTASSGTAGVQ